MGLAGVEPTGTSGGGRYGTTPFRVYFTAFWQRCFSIAPVVVGWKAGGASPLYDCRLANAARRFSADIASHCASMSVICGTDRREPSAACATLDWSGDGRGAEPEALPDDGVLDLCVIDDTGVLRALWHSRRLFRGTIDRMPGVRLFRSRCIRIARPRPGPLQVDGEATEAEAILEVKILPRAVRVAVPRGGPR